MESKSYYDHVFTQAVSDLSATLSINTIHKKMKEINEQSLISALEQVGNNEHLIESIKEKGLPKVVFCSEDKLIFCSIFFNFCKIINNKLLDSGSIILSWLDPDEIFPHITMCDVLIPGTFILLNP